MFSNLQNLKQTNVILILFILIKWNVTKVFGNGIDDGQKHMYTKDGSVIETQAFQEFFIEHNVTRTDAIKAFWEVGVKLLEDKPVPSWCRMIPCTAEIMQYCLGGRMLHDHCCCDSRHGKEELPWIPHSCYVGDSCLPNIGSCISYTEYRQCCCDRALAKQWKKIYSNAMKLESYFILMPLSILCLALRDRIAN